MKDERTNKIPGLDYFSSECAGCELCYAECSILNGLNMSPHQLANTLLGNQELPADIVSLVQQCSLCGLCSSHCPFGLNPGDLMQSARQSLINADSIEAEAYQPMLVDQQHHFFSLFRSSWQIDYSDLKRDNCETLFFPGCSLSSFAPELTRKVFSWLQDQGMDPGFSDSCCGLPLANIGLSERCQTHVARLASEFAKAGVTRIISACPNCYYHLQNQFAAIEVVSLYPLLEASGIQVPSGIKATIHDSCPDRYTGTIGESLRTIMSATEIVEMEHHGSKTICCGSGGIVSMVAPEVSQERAELRIAEIKASKADICVSTCMACVKRLHVENDDSPEVVHLLELIFDRKINHDQLQQRLEEMWQGELGRRNLELLDDLGHVHANQATKSPERVS